ncbi:MAG: hypothetical protein Q8Q19_00585 [Microbacterium sp.]|nr:hypothetical protein [Microbacterium sp.]
MERPREPLRFQDWLPWSGRFHLPVFLVVLTGPGGLGELIRSGPSVLAALLLGSSLVMLVLIVLHARRPAMQAK